MFYTRSLFLQKPTHVTHELRKANDFNQIELAQSPINTMLNRVKYI
jgi:hypothetical protein